jgi:cell division transport system permease protein
VRANFVLSGVATGIRRNMTMTIALVLSTAIALAFVGAAILADREIANFKHDYESKLNVSIFMCQKPILEPDPGDQCQAKYTEAERTSVQDQLESDPLVDTVTFVSEKEAVERFRETATPEVAKLTQVGDLPATFIVHLKDLRKDFDQFHSKFSKLDGVGGVQNQNEAIKTLLNAIDGVKFFSIMIAVVVLIASILLIANTIQVAAAQRKNETSIMRLVGASRWMTELPFMLETVISTFVGGLIALGLITVGKEFVLNNIFKVPVDNGVIPDLSTNSIIIAGGLTLIGGILLSAATAFATLRLYVRL